MKNVIDSVSRLWKGLTNKLHHGFNALLAILIISAESIMHAFHLPHVEGWWIPIIGGGALATSVSILHFKHKNRKIK